MSAKTLQKLEAALLDLDKEGTLAAVDALLADPREAGAQEGLDSIAEALRTVGKRFQDGEWFLGELVYAGEIAKQASERISANLPAASSPRRGMVVVGTVAGDLHDLGKNIFTTYARSIGFEVVDLGVDVPAVKFAAAVQTHRPLALGMSCLLTVCAGGIPAVMRELERRAIRAGVRVLVGGAALTEEFAKEAGADAFAPDAVTGTDIVCDWSAG